MPLDEKTPRNVEAGPVSPMTPEAGRSPTLQSLPVMIGVAAVTISVLGAFLLRQGEDRALEAATESAAYGVSTAIEQGVDRQMYGVIVLGWKWEWRDGAVRERWQREARELIDQHRLLYGIIWLDELRERLTSELAVDYDLSSLDRSEERIRIAESMDLAEASKRIISSTLIDAEGKNVFLIHIPLFRQGGILRGFVLGVYSLEDLLSDVLTVQPTGYHILVSESDRILWSSPGERLEDVPLASGDVSMMNLKWQLSISPGPEVVAIYHTWLPAAVGAGGSLMGLLVGVAVFMVLEGRSRTKRLLETNIQLREEMALRDRAEKEKKETEIELVDTMNSLPVHVWSSRIDSRGEWNIERMSTVLARISDRPVDYFDGSVENFLSVVHPADRDLVESATIRLIKGESSEVDTEYRIVRPDGTIRFMLERVRASRLSGGLRIAGVGSDLTDLKQSEEERRRLESRFQQAQKLESLGVLAGGIAHDFNNLLVAMLGHARLASQDLPTDSPIQGNVASIEKAARQAAELCEQMLAYAGKAPFDIDVVALEEIVEEMGNLLRASIPASSSIHFDFDPGVPCVNGDASQLRQIVLNLITNASEAIGDSGGDISLSVRAVECDSADFAQMDYSEGLHPGHFVALSVADTGCGMSEEVGKKIFEPFYTTKFAGRGLGLAAVLGIVRGHEGGIRIESETGEGTLITIVFPAATRVSRPLRRSDPEASLLMSRNEGKVLLVEDEESARELARIVLERSGFEVAEARDGSEAVEIFNQGPDKINWVLLDLTMPNLDGLETFRCLQQIRPDVRVILCSGHPELEAMSRFADLGLFGFLQKPYEPEELLASLRGREASDSS